MNIDKCVCFNISFDTMKNNKCTDINHICELYGCGTKCGMCMPYIKVMLKTGETRFERIITSDEND